MLIYFPELNNPDFLYNFSLTPVLPYNEKKLPAIVQNIDQLLLERLSKGDESALTDIYHLYWQQLFTTAYNVLKDKASCEDIVQDIFYTLWMRRFSLQIHSSLNAYLHSAVKYRVFQQIKAGQVHERVFEDIDIRCQQPTPDAVLVGKDIDQQVHAAINRLPEKCKEIYQLSRGRQLSHKEIASRMNISAKTVENQITIAIRKIRNALTDVNLLLLLLHLFRKN